MKRVLVSMAASLLLALAMVAPVAATTPGPGCSDFGAASAAGGHRMIPGLEGIPFGQVLQLFAHTHPGAISDIVASEHSTMCA